MKIWLFGTYAWQGNPKALFLFMEKYCSETHECWWIADNENIANDIMKTTGFSKVTFASSAKSKELFARADVYVTENFRESYPAEMAEKTKIFNTWHGVGLKHIELALGMDSVLVESIVPKYIKNFSKYKNQTLFLATSENMEKHFIEDTAINSEYIIRGQYPRNKVYHEIGTYQFNDILPCSVEEYSCVVLFSPTYRIGAVNGVLQQLLPDFGQLARVCEQSNQLFIVKVHPFMKKDSYFGEMQAKYEGHRHILFWDDKYDIYEIFDHIDLAIVDYSSIFYDLLDAGVNKFIRYVPDFNEYQQDLELIGDYIDLTDGIIIQNFTTLLNQLQNNTIESISADRKAYLMDYFFGYETDSDSLKDLVDAVDNCILQPSQLKELHSFDIFDTLIRRSTLKPFSVFDYVRDRAKESDIQFPVALIENWVTIRNKTEHDVRDIMRKTTFERKSNKIEILLSDVYIRLQKNFNLTDEQVNFLQQTEIEAEITHVEPIQKRIDFLFALKEAGHDVILVSDMYLPETTIRAMLAKVDSRLVSTPLYLSSTIGYQKSTGKLYQYIFFDLNYQYSRWVHYGDNKHADGSVPRKYGIETSVHDIDDFIPFENALVGAMDNYNRYPAYQLATKMHRYRTDLIQQMNNQMLEQKYYAYAYVGTAFVPYINWVIKDALQRGYETLYFISRDGHFLKKIADKIISIQGYDIKTKYIYGSRKAWRLPSFINKVDDETFWQFGNFVGMDSFDDLIKASYLSEDELLEIFPEFNSLKNAKHLRGEVAENIRKIMGASQAYQKKVLSLAAEKRDLVRKYLQQEINPDEKFVFVEFWGRGYTQDTFGRLLNDAFGREVINPFYYVRSFTDDINTSVRHNFILTPQNFSFFEPIFAQTPYESIPGYVLENGRVEPIIMPRDTAVSDWLSVGMLDFVSDYLTLETNDADYFDRAVSQFTYEYQLTENSDQFLCDVFSELKDNISSFGEVKSYAPQLTLKQLHSIASKQELDKLTLSISMSLAKSDKKVIDYYNKIQKSYKLPVVNVTPVQMSYAVNALAQYIYNETTPFKVIALQNNGFYFDVAFNENTKRKDRNLLKFHTIEVVAVDFLKNGVPRLLTEYGYLTAHKDWVQVYDDVSQHFEKDKQNEGYIWKPDFGIVGLIKVAIKQMGLHEQKNSVSQRSVETKSIGSQKTALKNTASKKSAPGDVNKEAEEFSVFQRKLYKFARDPYSFFKDAKNPRRRWLKVFFDEKHTLGRVLSRFVRRKFN